MTKPNVYDKGHGMEEALRGYFLKTDYYVIRGVPFSYEGFDITDIDLWLYGRASSISREIVIVDVKNRRTPQAIERIFWIQGLREAVKATKAVVATTEKRQAVKDFGRDLGVIVLDGSFIGKLNRHDSIGSPRLTDEEFYSLIDTYALEKLDGNWKGRINLCKSLLSRGLSFDSCNEWLIHSRFFLEQAITKPKRREIALRCLYLVCSFIAISIDFVLREFSFLEQTERITVMKEGFKYGSKGSAGMRKVLNVSMGLVEQYANDGKVISNQVRAGIERQLSELPTNILGEYFSKTDVAKTIFVVAKEFEYLSMKRSFSSHATATLDLRGMVGCLVDYWGFDRVQVSEALKEIDNVQNRTENLLNS